MLVRWSLRKKKSKKHKKEKKAKKEKEKGEEDNGPQIPGELQLEEEVVDAQSYEEIQSTVRHSQ